MKRKAMYQVDTSVDTFDAESVNLDLVGIGRRIKEARASLGLTQDDLASLAGATSKRGLQDNEAGKSMPGGQMLGALAAKGVSINWLLLGDEQGGKNQVMRGLSVNEDVQQYSVSTDERTELAVSPRILQSVVNFVFQWEHEHGASLDIEKLGKVIAILYAVASKSGKINQDELGQLLEIAA